ncbi:hypothetical protein [Sphingorhabdus sp.]|uniref:hypothetical protein n=1 Tax=Sphingorhabdus sp. TaxID=1902408 RepID=UPI00391CED1D
MSYMENNAAFAPAGGIQELSFDEIDLVGGAGRNLTATEVGLVAGGVGTAATVVGLGVAIAISGPIGIAIGIGAGMLGLGAASVGIGAGMASWKTEEANVKKK